MNRKIQGSAALLGATLIWGTAFIAQSVGMDYIGPMTFQAARCGLGALFLFVLATALGIPGKGLKGSLAAWRDARLWKAGLICGAALAVAGGLQQVGMVYTDAGKAGFITAMYIVLVPIFGIFLGRKPSVFAIFSVVLAVLGLYLLSCRGVSEINRGDVCLMGCAVGFSIQILCVDRLAPGLEGLRLNCVQACVVSLLTLPLVLTETVTAEGMAAAAMPIAYAGVLSMGIAYSLQIFGQKLLEPTAASLLMSLESVVAALSGWLLLHEVMTPWELCGCGLVFAGVIISQLPVPKKKEHK